MHFLSGWYRKKGKAREVNQDSIALTEMVVGQKRCVLAVVCDGIGGLEQGEVASGYACEELLGWFYRMAPRYLLKKKSGRSIIRSGNRILFSIHKKVKEWKKSGNMGTTVSMLLLLGRHYYVFHLGDSRIYRIRARAHRRSILLTSDHIKEGRLTGALCNFRWYPPECKRGRIHKGDTFLLCTDGFYRKLSEEQIRQTCLWGEIINELQIERNLGELYSYAEKKGERDDGSAVFIRVMQRGGKKNASAL